MKTDNYNDAMRDCQVALRYDDKNAKAYNKLSKCHIAFGDLVAASISLSKSLAFEPQNPTNKKDQRSLNDLKVVETLFKKAMAEDKYEKAVTNINQLLESCSHSIDLMCIKIGCLMKAYKFEEADLYTNKLVKAGGLTANHPKILMNRGKVLLYTGNEVLGKKFLQQAISFDPDLKECQLLIKGIKKAANLKEEGASIFKEQKFEEAIEHYKTCLELDPLNANYNSQILLNTAIAQVKLKKNDEAMKSLNLAIKYNPKYGKAYVKRGEVKMAIEDYNEAIRDFSEAAEIDATAFNI